jgi:hypothetical protein
MARARFAYILAIGLCLASAVGQATVPSILQPSWSELSPAQKQILAPLAADWDGMDQFRRSKWVGIAQRYPAMGAEEQARVQRRMTAWAKLTPEERKQAREKYKSLQKAPPEKKESVKQKWQEYKELPDEEKARLKANSPAQSAGGQTIGTTPLAKPAPAKTPLMHRPAVPASKASATDSRVKADTQLVAPVQATQDSQTSPR